MTTGRINQIAIFFVCVISGFSSLSRREYPKRNEVRQNELTNFHKSSARTWLCESESKSANFKRKPQKACVAFELQIFRSLLPCLGFPHRTSCLMNHPCYVLMAFEDQQVLERPPFSLMQESKGIERSE